MNLTVMFSQIESVTIYGAVNEHGKMVVSGILKEETAQKLIRHSLRDGVLSLYREGEEKSLFSGVIDDIILTKEGGLFEAVVTCSSFTSILDRVKISRSFQDKSMRYRDILEEISRQSKEKNRILVTADRAGERTGKPVIQYLETEWEFIKRIAGMLHTVILPEITYAMPQLCIGVIKGNRYEISDIEKCRKVLDMDGFRRGEGAKRSFFSYHIKNGENYELGDKITLMGSELTVVKKDLVLRRGCIEGRYVLGYEEGYCLTKETNKNIRGASLHGTVIDTKEGMVRLHLDMDSEQKKENAYWYRYAPVTGDIMYSVPECGAKVLLTIMSEKEEDAMVSGCLRLSSHVLPEPDTKTMWVRNESYVAAPEYMGFAYNGMNKMAALFLDDELGVVINSGKHIELEADGHIVMHAKGYIAFDSTTRMLLKHPKAEGEQAWVEMDCARMRLGGKTIVQNGGSVDKSTGSVETPALVISSKSVEDVMGMIPYAWSEAVYAAEGVRLESYDASRKDTYVTKSEENGKVETMEESVDSESDGEKKALIYIKGRTFNGYVLNDKTYVDDYYSFLKYSFDMNDHMIESLQNTDIEAITVQMGFSDMLSSWEQSGDLRIVVCNTDARNAHYKLLRKGSQIMLQIYVSLHYWICGGKETIPKKYGIGSIYSESTVLELFENGVSIWEGVYTSQTSKDTGIVYDDFGVDGLVEVKTEVFNDEQYGLANNIPDIKVLMEGEANNYQKFFYAAIIDNSKSAFFADANNLRIPVFNYCIEVLEEENRSHFQLLLEEWKYNAPCYMIAFRYARDSTFKYWSSLSEFKETIAHETGHVMGLGDGYDRSSEKGDANYKYMIGAKITNEVPRGSAMIYSKKITSNDIEMLIEAWKAVQKQQFYDASEIGFVKSSVIRQERKDKNWFEQGVDGIIRRFL